MICKVITNRYATETKSINLDIIKLINNPIIVTKKDDAPLFNLSFNQVTKPTKRAGFNHQGSSFLVLDYDCGFTFEQWQDKYNNLFGYTWMAYSSFNNSPDKAKYRIIMPLIKSYTEVEWKAMTRLLKRYFPENDVCSFQCSRFHNVPCKTEHYWFDLNYQSKNLDLLEILGIDQGYLNMLVSHVSQEPDEQPEVPRRSSVLNFMCVNDLTVEQWLRTPLNPNGGNNGIRTRGSYSAVQLCKKYGDNETLNLVKRKCYSCGLAKWFDKQ